MLDFSPKSLLSSLILLGLLLAGCGDASDAPSLGNWTLKTNGRPLTKELQVSETENFFFGSIQDLAVTTEGYMVVLDADATHLKVLRPDGTLIDTLGRQGQGPGEFERPRVVDIARGDSVYVFDVQRDRLTVFTPPPSSKLARTATVTSDRGYITKVRVLEDGLVGRFTPGYTREEGFRRPAPAVWRVLDETGVPGDTLLRARRRKLATSFEGPGAVIAYLPFGRMTRAAAGPDARLYHGYTDSLHIRATSLDGSTEAVASVPADPVRVTEAERDSALAGIGAEIDRQIGAALPETKPAFEHFVVADDGRLWVRRPTKTAEADTTAWWILAPASQTIQEVRLPTTVDIEVVQNGRAYGTTTTEAGAPAVVRYRIETSS